MKNVPGGQNHRCKGPGAGMSWAFEEQLGRPEACYSSQLGLGEPGGALAGGQSLWYYCKTIPCKRWSLTVALTFDPRQSASAPIKCNLSKPSRQKVSWQKIPGHPKAFPGTVFSRISLPGAARAPLLPLVPGTHTTGHQK